MQFFRTRFPVPTLVPQSGADGPERERAVEQYAIRLWEFYDSRARWHRRLFRSSGIVVIVIGATLPLLAAPTYGGKQFIISLAGLLVALLTGLRAFYHWDATWILLRKTEMAISEATWHWWDQLDKGDRAVATTKFIDTLMKVRQKEADGFFGLMGSRRGEAHSYFEIASVPNAEPEPGRPEA